MYDEEKMEKYFKKHYIKPAMEFKPVIEVNCGCHDKKKDECECKGFVNSDNILANICPDCNFFGSTFTLPNLPEFVATSINPPFCESTPQGVLLFTGGTGIFAPYVGFYTLVLFETQNGSDIAFFSFFGTAPDGGLVLITIVDIVDDENLSVNQCVDKNCPSPGKSLTSKFRKWLDEVSKTNKNGMTRLTIMHPNGQVEEKDLKR